VCSPHLPRGLSLPPWGLSTHRVFSPPTTGSHHPPRVTTTHHGASLYPPRGSTTHHGLPLPTKGSLHPPFFHLHPPRGITTHHLSPPPTVGPLHLPGVTPPPPRGVLHPPIATSTHHGASPTTICHRRPPWGLPTYQVSPPPTSGSHHPTLPAKRPNCSTSRLFHPPAVFSFETGFHRARNFISKLTEFQPYKKQRTHVT